jgi:hypothetical protein
MPIKLGQKVRDRVTGYKGIAECITTWRYGCIRIGVRTQKLDEKGLPQELIHFDEPQLEIIEDIPDQKTKKIHGPRSIPQRGR